MDMIVLTRLLIVPAVLALYFTPGIVSRVRRCKAHNGILVVNLFLGWTFIGWVVALAWASSGAVEPKPGAPARQLTEEEQKLALYLFARGESSTPPNTTPNL